MSTLMGTNSRLGDAAPPVWATIIQRLGATMDDPSSNVRSNLVTLAATVSASDPDALAALVDFGAAAAENLAAEASPAEKLVLQAVMDERHGLDPDLRSKFDELISARLEAVGVTSNTPKTVDALLLAVPAVQAILPSRLLADAALTDARRLPTSDRRPDDATERDRILGRLARLRQAVEGLAAAEREAFRRAVADRLAGFAKRDRRASLLAIMRWAPWIAKTPPGGTPIAKPAQFDSAAGYDHPGWLRILWWALCGGAVGSGGLILVTMLVLWDRYIAGTWTLPSLNILLELGLLAAFVALLSGLTLTPSAGRTAAAMRSLRRLCVPSFVGAVSVVIGSFIIHAGEDWGFFSTRDPAIQCAVLFVTLFLLLALVFWSLPLALRDIVNRRSDWQVSLAVVSASGPAIVLASLICGTAYVGGIRPVSDPWPILVASLIATALVATRIEIAKWPVLADSESATARRIRQLTAAAPALPIALMIIGITVTAVTLHPKYRLSSGSSGPQHLVMAPHRHVAITLDGTDKVTIKISSGDHVIYMLHNGDRTRLDANSQLSDRDELCVDDCGDDWPTLAEWLPLLIGAHAMAESVDITVEVTPQ
jgi:hypothetical protein